VLNRVVPIAQRRATIAANLKMSIHSRAGPARWDGGFANYGRWLTVGREGTAGVAAAPKFTFRNISSRSGRMNENRKILLHPADGNAHEPTLGVHTPPPDTPGGRPSNR
jgi:hypothetical protein